MILTPKNQHMGTTNVCPLCQVTDVTIRYNKMSHAGGGMQIATAISGDGTNGDNALAGARYSIHDIVIDDVRADYFFAEQAKGDLRVILGELIRLRGVWGEDEQALAFVASVENMLGIAGSGSLRDRVNLLIEKFSSKHDYYRLASKEYETIWRK